MNEKITMVVTCANCGSPFTAGYESLNSDPTCPECGLAQMHIHLTIEDHVGVEIHDTLRGKLKDPNVSSKKNPRVDFFAGDDLRRSDGKWMQKKRVLDRDNDRYIEVVVDPETGKIVHKNDEPLSKHVGHGTAKFKK